MQLYEPRRFKIDFHNLPLLTENRSKRWFAPKYVAGLDCSGSGLEASSRPDTVLSPPTVKLGAIGGRGWRVRNEMS